MEYGQAGKPTIAEIRRGIHEYLDPEAWQTDGISPLNKLILWIVLASVASSVLDSEPLIRESIPTLFLTVNLLFALLFTVEYAVRFWVIGENPRYRGFLGRIRYAASPFCLLDIVAILALWADIVFAVPGVYGVFLRLARLLRIVSLARRSKWAMAIRLLGYALAERRYELALSAALAFVVLLISATALFLIEGEIQPEAFGSIPRAMWWAMATLTTVGYGDAYPVTAVGKIFAGCSAIIAIGIVAMPTGIMAAAFSSTFQKLHAEKNTAKLLSGTEMSKDET